MVKNSPSYSLSVVQLIEATRKFATDKSPEDFAEFIGVPYQRYQFAVKYDDTFSFVELSIIFNRLKHLETSVSLIHLMHAREQRS